MKFLTGTKPRKPMYLPTLWGNIFIFYLIFSQISCEYYLFCYSRRRQIQRIKILDRRNLFSNSLVPINEVFKQTRLDCILRYVSIPICRAAIAKNTKTLANSRINIQYYCKLSTQRKNQLANEIKLRLTLSIARPSLNKYNIQLTELLKIFVTE